MNSDPNDKNIRPGLRIRILDRKRVMLIMKKEKREITEENDIIRTLEKNKNDKYLGI